MTKQDLKTGMLVKIRDGRILMLINECFSHQGDGYIMDIKGIKNDLTSEFDYGGPMYDIMKVSRVMTGSLLTDVKNWNGSTLQNDIIWTRPDPIKKMTVAEISNELGYDVEIVKG